MYTYRVAHEMSYHFIITIKIVTSQYRCCKRASECCSSWKMRQMSPVCKMVILDFLYEMFNLQLPNDIYIYIYIYIYICRTAPLTSSCCILYINSTNIRTEYFKHAAHSPFFSSSKCRLFHKATFFGSCIIHILNTGCAKI